MADTPRSTSYLTGTVFADGQPAGSITPQDMRDFVVSGPQFDDPSNASGLSTPALLRGTVNADRVSGLTKGTGLTTTVRQANATQLNAMFTYCVSNGKFLEMPPGTYEIDTTTGLVIPANADGFVLRGTTQTKIVQYNAASPGCPILTIGDNTTLSYGFNIHGLSLSLGAAQTGNTSSAYLKMGQHSMGLFEQINLGDYGYSPEYGLYIPDQFFSNRMTDVQIAGFLGYAFYYDYVGGTPNRFDNFYMVNNDSRGSSSACSGYIWTTSDNAQFFSRLNMEWGTCTNVITLGSNASLEVIDCHVEGIVLSGTNPALMLLNGNTVSFTDLEWVRPIIKTANITTTPASVIQEWPGGVMSSVRISQFRITDSTSGDMDTALWLFYPADTALQDYAPNYVFEGGFMNDPNNEMIPNGYLQFDYKMPVATFLVPSQWSRYEYNTFASKVVQALLQVSAAYTHYGQYEDAVIQVPASITSFTLTLANTMGATGTQPVRTGNTVRIRRMSGTASGTLTISFGGTGSPTTNTTAAIDYFFVFDGTHWQTLTPVTDFHF